MSSKEIEVFVICDADSFAPGAAKDFRLSRIDENGETRPFPIVVIRTAANEYVGYANACAHKSVMLNAGNGKFFSQDKKFLECGQHGALYEIETGLCVDGPCKGKSLKPIALAVIDDEVCVCGVKLVEDDGIPDPFGTPDDGPIVLIDSD